MGLSLFQRLFLISTPFVALSSLAQTLDRDQLLSREVWLFQNCRPSFRIVMDRPGAIFRLRIYRVRSSRQL